MIKSADDIQQCSLSAARMTENSNKFVLSERYVNAVESRYLVLAAAVFVVSGFFAGGIALARKQLVQELPRIKERVCVKSRFAQRFAERAFGV